jgi:hypothetical protein
MGTNWLASCLLMAGAWLSPLPALAQPAAEPPESGAARDEPEPEAGDQNGPVQYPVEHEGKRNTGLLVGGIVCASVGGASALVGAVMLGLASADSTQVCENNNCHPATQQDRDTLTTGGTVAVIAGLGLAALGIPMIVIGAKRRTAEAGPGHIAVGVGPRGASLSLRF